MDLPLGKPTEYVDQYAPALLQAIPRADNRATLRVDFSSVFGVDYWTAYEMSWLDSRGKPQVGIAHIAIPSTSDFIVESKSLKLYLNSLNQMHYDSREIVAQLISDDLSQLLHTPVIVTLSAAGVFQEKSAIDSVCIDDEPMAIDSYDYSPESLSVRGHEADEVLSTHLLRSLCPVTKQPDWATLYVGYTGPAIDRQSLLKYVVGYRLHCGFHEACIEQIYNDLMERCQPKSLWVYGRFLRRGGIDINPYRSSVHRQPDLGVEFRQ